MTTALSLLFGLETLWLVMGIGGYFFAEKVFLKNGQTTYARHALVAQVIGSSAIVVMYVVRLFLGVGLEGVIISLIMIPMWGFAAKRGIENFKGLSG